MKKNTMRLIWTAIFLTLINCAQAASQFFPNDDWIHGPYYGNQGDVSVHFADVTGDGRADAIVVNQDKMTVRRSDGTQFTPNEDWTQNPYYGSRGTFFADVTGDGKADAIVVNDDTVTVRRSNGSLFTPNEDWSHGPYYGNQGNVSVYFADVTGDGRADAIVVNRDKVTVRRSDGSQFTPNEDWTQNPYYGGRGTFFADVTGDGKADAIVVNDDTVTVRRSNGSLFTPNEDWTHGPYYGNQGNISVHFADATGDGKADAIVVNHNKVTVRRSDGMKFKPNEDGTHNPYYGQRGTFFADVTGDGKADAIVVNNQSLTVRRSGMQALDTGLIRVGVFNMSNPDLAKLNWNQRIEALRGWGNQLFSMADIVILSELGTPSNNPWDWWNDIYINTLSESSGLNYRQAAWGLDPTYPDVGILSRFPIRQWSVHELLPTYPARILDVKAELPQGEFIRVLGTHSVSVDDNTKPSPGRVKSANKVHELVQNTSGITLFGGDLNTCPPVPPGEELGALKDECVWEKEDGTRYSRSAEGVEYNMLIRDLVDSFRAASSSKNDCNSGRIDYLFFRGPLKVISYDNCFPNAPKEPSDHPYILVTLQLNAAAPPTPRACPSGQRCCGVGINSACNGQCWPTNQLCP